MQPGSFRNSLDNTIRFIHDLDRARNVEDISAQLLRHLGQIGAEHVIATTIPVPGATPRQQLKSVLFFQIPEEWVTRYAAKGYAFRDPIIRRMTKLAGSFYWNELEEERHDDPSARRILEEGSELGLKKGFSTSLLTLDRQLVGFSLSGKDFETNPEARGVLTLVATYAIGRAIALQQESSDQERQIRLSAREREALQWASEGKADWEIGEIMSISEHGADKHLRSARSKLGAINRTQAVAEAIRRGLIA
ncbi:MAG TPA: autoinducer binding domain-containing protein [Methylocella sp.]|jgi:LuxR family transcriptional regulator, quorum-sensing system regulator BjaR1|nr:autoinducer binding domain-containing protein [Methylocella sp.]